MALITCPECGKEISDKSKYCINCGVPIKKRKQIQKNTKIIILLSAVCLIIILTVIYYKLLRHNNVFEEYTTYIGKSYEELPDTYKIQELTDGYYFAKCKVKAEDAKFTDLDGTISYNFFDEETSLAESYEIYAMHWNTEVEFITDKDIENIKKILENTYGKYDSEREYDNTDRQYQYREDSFLCQRYIWDNQNGLEIWLNIDKNENRTTDISIYWKKASFE